MPRKPSYLNTGSHKICVHRLFGIFSCFRSFVFSCNNLWLDGSYGLGGLGCVSANVSYYSVASWRAFELCEPVTFIVICCIRLFHCCWFIHRGNKRWIGEEYLVQSRVIDRIVLFGGGLYCHLFAFSTNVKWSHRLVFVGATTTWRSLLFRRAVVAIQWQRLIVQ